MLVINECSVISRINTLLTIYYFKILASKVIVSRDELYASNGEDGMVRGRLLFPPVGHGSHAAAAGTNARLMDGKATAIGRASCRERVYLCV